MWNFNRKNKQTEYFLVNNIHFHFRVCYNHYEMIVQKSQMTNLRPFAARNYPQKAG